MVIIASYIAIKSKQTRIKNLKGSGDRLHVQWNLSKADTIGESISVLYIEVSLFQGF